MTTWRPFSLENQRVTVYGRLKKDIDCHWVNGEHNGEQYSFIPATGAQVQRDRVKNLF